MKFTKKLFVLAALTGISIPVLAACSCDGGIDTRTKVVFWHTMGKSSIEILDAAIADFEKQNPDIKVEHSAKGDYNALKTAVENAIAAGDVPTMAYCYPDHVANYLTSSAVVKVNDLMEADPFTEEEGLVDDFIDAYWQEGQSYDVEGIYSVPFAKSTEVMFYNKDFFDTHPDIKIPTTWTEMEETCAKIKALSGYEDKVPFGYDSDDNLFITLCEQYGIPYTTNNNITKAQDHFLFNNAKAKEMVNRVKSWYDNGWFTSKGTSTDGGYTSTRFKNGELLMTIGSTGGTTYNYSDNFNIGIAPIPGAESSVEGGNSHVIMQGPSICFLRRVTPEQKAASWKFYKYIINAENTANFSTKTGYSPARKSSFNTDLWEDFMKDETIVAAEDLVRRTVDFNSTLMDKYFVSATFKGSSTARVEVGGIITTVCTGSKTVEEAFREAYDNCAYAVS